MTTFSRRSTQLEDCHILFSPDFSANREKGHGWMARLSPVRDELLRGDLRSLYIGWLAAVTGKMMDDDELEPAAMSGLGGLTAAQQALADLLEVDPDLLAGSYLIGSACCGRGLS